MRAHYIGRVERRTAAQSGRRLRISFRWLTAFAKRINRWFFGGSTPRAAGRREFPEVEFHQVLSGKKDYFDPVR